MTQWKAAPRAILLALSIAGTAHAGPPPELASHSGFAGLAVRGSLQLAGQRSVFRDAGGSLTLQLGRISWSGFTFAAPDAFTLRLLAAWADHALDVVGTRIQTGARVKLVPDSETLRDELAEAVALLCERVHGAELCVETLTGLEPRLRRTRLVLRARTVAGETRGRLRGRFELRLVDPTTGAAAVRASFAFRNHGNLLLHHASVGGVGFGGTFISLGNPDTDPAP